SSIAELELALEVGAPQIIGKRTFRQRRAARAVARPAAALDQAVAVEHRVNGAFGGNLDISVEATHQQFADLAGAPVRLLALQPDDQGLDLLRLATSVTAPGCGAVAHPLQPVLLL